VEEAIARIGTPSCTGDPARTAARIRRHLTHHEQVIPRNPHAQIENRIAGSGVTGDDTVAKKLDDIAGVANGWLTWSITTDKFDGMVSGTLRHGI